MTIREILAEKGINFKEASGGKELVFTCPWCNGGEKHEYKLSLNATTGNFMCFRASCDVRGQFKNLLEKLELPPDTQVDLSEDKPEEWTQVAPIDEEVVNEYHNRLIKMLETDNGLQEYLHKKRGYTIDTIKKFKIGWGDKRNITIPIYENGFCVNFKMKSDPTIPGGSKGMYSISGRGKKRLFNASVLNVKTKKDTERVIICEGEWDCMLLDQYGYSAVTSTGGAMSFDDSWISAFNKFDKVYLCFDNDRYQAGQKGAKKTAELFLKHGIRVFIIQLPPPFPTEDKVDVTDFFTTRKKVKIDFTELLKTAIEYSGGEIQQEQYRIIDFQTLMERTYPPQRWIVDHLIPADGLTCIAGLPGTMKSYFTNYMAKCIVEGSSVLDRFATKKVPILLIDKENNPARIQQRFNLLGIDKQYLKDNLFYWDKGEFLVEKENSIQVAENMIQKYGIKLTIIDTMVRIHTKAENDASEMNRVYQALRRLQNAGSAVLFIHHFNKSGSGVYKTTDVRELLRGSGDILGWLDSYFALKIVENGLIRLEVGKSRDEKPISSILIEPGFYEEETTFNYMGEVKEEEVFKQVATEKLVSDLLLTVTSLPRGEIIKRLSGVVSTRTIDQTLARMKKLGKVIALQNGKEVHYSLERETANEYKEEIVNMF